MSAEPAPARCPKCDTGVAEGAEACPACGLAARHFGAYESAPIDAPPEVLAAWHDLAAAWDQDAAHERFRAAVAAARAFAFAAGAYRRAARERAGDERAADGLARVQRMAEAALLTRPPGAELAREPGARSPYRGAALLLVALLLLAGVGVIAAFMIRAVRSDPDPRPPSRAQPSPSSQSQPAQPPPR